MNTKMRSPVDAWSLAGPLLVSTGILTVAWLVLVRATYGKGPYWDLLLGFGLYFTLPGLLGTMVAGLTWKFGRVVHWCATSLVVVASIIAAGSIYPPLDPTPGLSSGLLVLLYAAPGYVLVMAVVLAGRALIRSRRLAKI
ncbi:MAG: hypothetical protein ACTH2Q_02510 [Propionibacteriaceae bacterium]